MTTIFWENSCDLFLFELGPWRKFSKGNFEPDWQIQACLKYNGITLEKISTSMWLKSSLWGENEYVYKKPDIS